VKAYHTKDEIFATLLLAENCGVNTLLTNPILCTLIDEYWKRNIGQIQFISDCVGLDYSKGTPVAIPFTQYLDRIKRAIDYSACACYIQGETTDHFLKHGQLDQLSKAIEFIRQNRVMVGMGAHEIETIMASVDAGLAPDFWMKTLHPFKYWSAQHPQEHDNVFCRKPDEYLGWNHRAFAFQCELAGTSSPSLR
jgi:hypothetical protein